jgi:hypothetical protein
VEQACTVPQAAQLRQQEKERQDQVLMAKHGVSTIAEARRKEAEERAGKKYTVPQAARSDQRSWRAHMVANGALLEGEWSGSDSDSGARRDWSSVDEELQFDDMM